MLRATIGALKTWLCDVGVRQVASWSRKLNVQNLLVPEQPFCLLGFVMRIAKLRIIFDRQTQSVPPRTCG